jgi:hypothetical protein
MVEDFSAQFNPLYLHPRGDSGIMGHIVYTYTNVANKKFNFFNINNKRKYASMSICRYE